MFFMLLFNSDGKGETCNIKRHYAINTIWPKKINFKSDVEDGIKNEKYILELLSTLIQFKAN